MSYIVESGIRGAHWPTWANDITSRQTRRFDSFDGANAYAERRTKKLATGKTVSDQAFVRIIIPPSPGRASEVVREWIDGQPVRILGPTP